MTWRDAVRDAWSLLFPVECVGCGIPDRGLCSDCGAALEAIPSAHHTAAGLKVQSTLAYRGAVRRALLALKEQDRVDAAAHLAPALAVAIAAARPGTVELTTVPSSRAAFRRRGFDPVRLLAVRAGLRPARTLRHRRGISRQKTLGAQLRAENMAGALMASRSLAGRSFLILDDVLTTGATLDEAARAIRAAGGRVAGAATLAFTPRLLPFRDTLAGPY